MYRYFEELSIVEIAQMLSISSNTVKTRLKKSRALLKEQLKHKQWEELLNEGN
ncbi:RNA polymerase sigma factor [Bacillus sp. FJAT-22090]|uniref:RNA polymerase sigma factor n=1 Tax=Bacillus sp. FJAT-22090 TaxID=1581038 RepID=UPI003FA46314